MSGTTSAGPPSAGGAPADADPILSDDGWWQWDGSAWVPAAVPPIPTQPVLAEPSIPGYPSGSGSAPGYPTASSYPMASSYPSTPGYPSAMGYALPADRGRDGLAVAALVCSLIPIFAVAQLLALVFAIIVLTRVGRTGQKGQVMAIYAIGVSVLMFFISAAIAIPVFLNQRQKTSDVEVKSALRNTASLEETYYVQNATYADAAQLNAFGERVPPAIELDLAAGRSGFCLTAGPRGGTRWLMYDSFHGGLQTTVFTSATDAIDTCVSRADAAGGSSAT